MTEHATHAPPPTRNDTCHASVDTPLGDLHCTITRTYHGATHETSETVPGYTRHKAAPVEVVYTWPGTYQPPTTAATEVDPE